MGESGIAKRPAELLTLENRPSEAIAELFEQTARTVEKTSVGEALSETARLLVEQASDRAEHHSRVAGTLAWVAAFMAASSLGVDIQEAIPTFQPDLANLEATLRGLVAAGTVYGMIKLSEFTRIGAKNTVISNHVKRFRSTLRQSLKKAKA